VTAKNVGLSERRKLLTQKEMAGYKLITLRECLHGRATTLSISQFEGPRIVLSLAGQVMRGPCEHTLMLRASAV
jgi:hypothetical protein